MTRPAGAGAGRVHAPDDRGAGETAARPLSAVQIAASLEAEASGPSYTVPALARALQRAGHRSALVSLGPPGEGTTQDVPHSRYACDLERLGPAARLGVSGAMKAALAERARSADILHTHGLWMMPNVYPGALRRRHRFGFVLSPRGMLNPAALRYSRQIKRAFWALWQARAARQVDLFHATSAGEADEIRAAGLSQPIAIIPNGIDVAGPPAPWSDSRTVLSLGRIHPKKGLDMLVEAWARIAPRHPGWILRLVGPSEGGHAGELARQVARLGLADSVAIDGPLYGAEKRRAYESAELFVLPTRGENFGMTVAESLAAGRPVISTRGAPWGGLVEEGCGWWVEIGAAPLAEALEEALALAPEARARMGRTGAEWMARDYAWDAIGAKMAEAYRWIGTGGPAPAWIRQE